MDFDNTFLEGSNIRDSMGCPIKPTFYTTIIGTDFDIVTKFNKKGIFFEQIFIFKLFIIVLKQVN